MSIRISGSVLVTDDLTEISETEFKYLNAQNAGTAKASAAVILGSSKEISGLGDVSAAALSGSGNLNIGGTVRLDGAADTAAAVANDSFYFMDADDNLVKKESMADYAASVAGSGLAAASGVLSVDLNEVPAAAVNVAADSLLILDADDSDATKKESFVDLMTAAAGDGLAASAGVLAMDVNELTAFTAVQDSDAIAMSDGTDTKKMTRANLLGSALAAFSNGLSSTTIAASSNATVEGIVSGAAGTFDALAGTSLALQGGGISAAGPIAGATTIAASSNATVEGIVSGAAGTFDALAGTSLALQGGGITAAGAIYGASTIAASSNATIEGIVSGAAGTFDALAGTSLALQGGGITAAGPVAGATTVSGSGAFSMSAIDNDGVLNNAGAANIVGKLSVTAVSDLDGGIDVNASKFTVSAAGAMLASSAKIADISNGGIVFGSGGDGELSVHSGLGYNSGTSTLAATNVSSSGNIMALGTLSVDGQVNLRGATNVTNTFTTLGNASLGNANSDVTTLVGQVTSSAGMHISAKSGVYALSVADGAGDAIAQAWVTHSDRNLKTNIQELDNDAALNAVMSLQPSTYEKKATGKSEIGFIAQEVAQVVPEICALDANGEGRGIDYSRMSTLLAGALKAQQEQIAQLKEIVAKLQK